MQRRPVTPKDYDLAVDFVRRHAVMEQTTARLSKHLGIGFNDAARLVERMTNEGVLAECDSKGRRQVLRQNEGASER